MIMGAKTMIKRALRGAQGTLAPAKIIPADAPSMIAMPQPLAQADATMIFRSALLRAEADGADLVGLLAGMITSAPGVAEGVIARGNLGEVSRARSAEALRTYGRTGVAVLPDRL